MARKKNEEPQKVKQPAKEQPAAPVETPTADTYDPERHANHSHLNP